MFNRTIIEKLITLLICSAFILLFLMPIEDAQDYLWLLLWTKGASAACALLAYLLHNIKETKNITR